MSFLTQPISAIKGSPSDGGTPHERSREQSLMVDTVVEPRSKWQKILDELNYVHEAPIEKYSITPVGFNLYKWLLEGQLLEKIPLHITLPQTLIKDENDVTYMLHTVGDRLVKKKVTAAQFDAHLQRAIPPQPEPKGGPEEKKSIRKNKVNFTFHTANKPASEHSQPYLLRNRPDLNFRLNSCIPYIVQRTPNIGKEHETLMDKEFLTYRSTTEVRYKASRGKILQRFIFSRNLKAILLRLCYHTRNNQSSEGNYMHRAQNHTNQLRWNARTEIFESTPQLAFVTIDKDCPDRFEFSTIRGKALQPYERMAQSLAGYLERAMSVRISKLYVDFLLSVDGIPYFTNLKWLELKPSCRLELDCSSLTCTVYCKLCAGSFRKDEVTKTLTYKLLFELVEHLKKRTRRQDQSSKLLHQLSFNENVNKPCQLCNVCYMLVVSQHELIQVERELARIVNIPICEERFVGGTGHLRNRPAYLPSHLNQWRILLYFSEVSQLDPDISGENAFLQYRFDSLHNFSDGFRLGQLEQLEPSVQPVNKLKVHYFFSESLNIDKFLAETNIKIRLTQGPDWNRTLAEGSSCTVSHFKNKTGVDCGQRHSSNILLFYENCKYCELTLSVGLVLDGSYNTLDLNLYKDREIYVTDGSYYTSNPLPKEWMEMYALNYDNAASDALEYSPICTEEEIRKMVGIQHIRKGLRS